MKLGLNAWLAFFLFFIWDLMSEVEKRPVLNKVLAFLAVINVFEHVRTFGLSSRYQCF